MDILTLHRKGLKQRAIARKLGISRNTVKKYIEDPELVLAPAKPRQRKSLLDPFHDTTLMEIFNHSTQKQTLAYLCVQPDEIRNVYENEL